MTTTSFTLKAIPKDVYDMVQLEQAEIKKKRRTGMFSFECTIYKMLKDYNRCRDGYKRNDYNIDLNKKEKETSSYTLKAIPGEVYDIVLSEQSSIKMELQTGIFSFESTIYEMIRDYNRCRKENIDFKPEPA